MRYLVPMRKAFIVVLAAMFAWSCEREASHCVTQPDVSAVHVEFELERFTDSIARIDSKNELVALLTREPLFRDYIFRRTAYPDDSVFVNSLYERFTNPHFDTLIQETKRVFGDERELRAQFEEAFRNMKYYYPDFVPPRVKTLVSGLDTDLLVTDTLIIVSLDFYLGAGAKYRPGMYEYLLRQYEKNNIVPSCMLMYGIDRQYNHTDMSDRSVLADMIAYGKSYYFAKHMLPCTPDSVLMRYTAKEIEGSQKNQDLIWARLLEDKVLFETSHIVKQRYLGERPKTLEVGEECPGRIGQWVGWQIVNAYMKSNPDVTLPELMVTANAQDIFKRSGYKPDRR